MSRLRWIPAVFCMILALAPALAGAGEIPGAALESVLEMLSGSRNVRYVLRSTDEGAALAERLIGRRVRSNSDFGRLADELRKPGHEADVETLEGKFRRLEAGSGDFWLRTVAREELTLSPSSGEDGRMEFVETDGARNYEAVRAAFLAGGDAPASGLNGALTRLKVAAVQYPVEGGKTVDEVLARVEHYAMQAKANGAQLVVLPELFVLDLVDPHSGVSEADQLAGVARDATPRIFARAAELSRRLDIAILAGSSPRVQGDGIVNTAQIAFPDGRVIQQDKLFLTPDEVNWHWKPGNELKVFDAPWGRTTILICYDSQFPSISASLGREAPEVILVPSMTGANGFSRVRLASQARAIEHHAYVVVTGTIDGPGGTNDFVAQAGIFTPRDEGFPGILGEGPRNRESIVYGDLDMNQLRASRRAAGLYAARDASLRDQPIEVVHVPTAPNR